MIMTPEDQIKAIAELDGWTNIHNANTMAIGGIWRGYPPTGQIIGKPELLPPYLISRDAIVPVIEKHPLEVKRKVVNIVSDLFYSSKDEKNQWYNGGWRVDCKAMACLFSTPSQLCEALLRATGKWIE
jgi:hypothetical protein